MYVASLTRILYFVSLNFPEYFSVNKIAMDFCCLSRKDLQTLCKKNKIPANMTNVAMADALSALETVEGMEEIQKSPEKTEVTMEDPRTCRRTSSRLRPVKDSAIAKAKESVGSISRARRGTVKKVPTRNFSEESCISDLQETPLVFPTSRKRVTGKSVGAISGVRFDEERGIEKVAETDTITRGYNTRRSSRLAVKSMGRKLEEAIITSLIDEYEVQEEKPNEVEKNGSKDLPEKDEDRENLGSDDTVSNDVGVSLLDENPLEAKFNIEETSNTENLDVIVGDYTDFSGTDKDVEIQVYSGKEENHELNSPYNQDLTIPFVNHSATTVDKNSMASIEGFPVDELGIQRIEEDFSGNFEESEKSVTNENIVENNMEWIKGFMVDKFDIQNIKEDVSGNSEESEKPKEIVEFGEIRSIGDKLEAIILDNYNEKLQDPEEETEFGRKEKIPDDFETMEKLKPSNVDLTEEELGKFDQESLKERDFFPKIEENPTIIPQEVEKFQDGFVNQECKLNSNLEKMKENAVNGEMNYKEMSLRKLRKLFKDMKIGNEDCNVGDVKTNKVETRPALKNLTDNCLHGVN